MITLDQAIAMTNSYTYRAETTDGLLSARYALASLACAAAMVAALRGEDAALRWVGDGR